jgi:hypothetical protein
MLQLEFATLAGIAVEFGAFSGAYDDECLVRDWCVSHAISR